MNFMEVIQGRRSVRRYRQDEVPDELLDQVLEAVRWAPSGGNIQPWEVVVVKDPEVKKKLQDTVGDRNPAKKTVVTAPVLLVLCGRVGIPEIHKGKSETKFGDWWFMFHLGTAAQNLCLAAHALGLGTLMLGFFDHDRAKEILNVPDGVEVAVLIPLGYPDKTPRPPERRSAEDFIHREKYGS